MLVPTAETSDLYNTEDGTMAGKAEHPNIKIERIVQSEQGVFKDKPGATHFRYPSVYGANQLLPWEWSIVRRCLDKRPHLILPDGGLTV